jgi:transcriptional regulator with XRE-family HTH domain
MRRSHVVLQVGATIKDLRRQIGWSQRALAARSNVSQSLISDVENGQLPSLTFATVTRLLEAMGGRLVVDVTRPFLGDRERQRDAAHIRCVTYAARQLERRNWSVATEVEIGSDRSRGWVDVIAFHSPTRTQLVIEIKTELHDVGAIERSLRWYERESWTVARRLGHRPQVVVPCLLVLATEANDARIRDNRAAFDRTYPVRAQQLNPVAERGAGLPNSRWGLAMIDPRSRRRDWLRPTVTDGRRSVAPYADYAGFMSHVLPARRGQGRHSTSDRTG